MYVQRNSIIVDPDTTTARSWDVLRTVGINDRAARQSTACRRSEPSPKSRNSGNKLDQAASAQAVGKLPRQSPT